MEVEASRERHLVNAPIARHLAALADLHDFLSQRLGDPRRNAQLRALAWALTTLGAALPIELAAAGAIGWRSSSDKPAE